MEMTSPQRILVAEDEAGIRRLLHMMLTREGYEVDTAADGQTALDKALNSPPELILLDVNMPGMDGLSVCRALKAADQTRHIPIIFISSSGEEQQGLQAGAVDYISKPFNFLIVRSRVKNQLKLKEYQDYLERLVQDRTRKLEETNRQLLEEIRVREAAEAALKKHQEVLEETVEIRTAALQMEIAARKDTEKRLRLSEEKYRTVFENAGAATLILEPDLTISMANAEAERLTGYSRNELRGMRWSRLVDDAGVPWRLDAVPEAGLGAAGVVEENECILTTSRGKQRNLIVKQTLFSVDGRRLLSCIDISRRKKTEAILRENMAYLDTVMDTIQTGVIVTDTDMGRIQDINSHALDMLGGVRDDFLGKDVHRFIQTTGDGPEPCLGLKTHSDKTLLTLKAETVHVRHAHAHATLRGRDRVIHSFLDISDIKELMKRQELEVDLAKSILNELSPPPPRHVRVAGNVALFMESLSIPCHLQGGDHVLFRSFGDDGADTHRRSVLAIKDQSGHQVGCVLRSILTDLIHNEILNRYGDRPLPERIQRLNREICNSTVFQDDDFFTALFLEFDHVARRLIYAGAGHPPFLLIREGTVQALPAGRGSGANLPMGFVPDATFCAAEISLQAGDRLLLFTDGLTDALVKAGGRSLTPNDLLTGISRMMAARPDIPVSLLAGQILATLSAAIGEPILPPDRNPTEDDITLIAMEIEDARWLEERVMLPQDVQSVWNFIDDLSGALFRQWDASGFQNPIPRLATVLEESVLNAYYHGNACDPHKEIRVRWRFGNDFHIEIINSGPGFDPGDVPDPTRSDNVLKSKGRGLFMIRHFTHEHCWRDQGRCLSVIMKRQADRDVPIESQGLEDIWRSAASCLLADHNRV